MPGTGMKLSVTRRACSVSWSPGAPDLKAQLRKFPHLPVLGCEPPSHTQATLFPSVLLFSGARAPESPAAGWEHVVPGPHPPTRTLRHRGPLGLGSLTLRGPALRYGLNF